MDKNNLLSILSIIIVFISVLFSIFLLTVKTKHKLSNVLLALFILLNALDISAWFLDKYMMDHLNLLLFKVSCSWLINPVFYLYALSICYSDFTLRKKHLWHIIPFVLFNLVMIPRFYTVDLAAQMHYLENYNDQPERIFSNVLGHVQFYCYIIAIFLLLRRYRTIYLENYTDASTITYRWLFQLTVIITIIHSIVLVKDLINFTSSDNDFFNNAQIIVAFNAMLILCWFVLKALYHPTLFRGVDSSLQPVENLVTKEIASTPLEEKGKVVIPAVYEKQINQLKDFMIREEPFLDASLTIQDLARRTGIPVRDLSLLINHHLHQHFFDFVNEYRIQKAMVLLKDPSKQAFTIQEIFYEVGFNSKSSFNTAFKKYTGQTPTQFRTGS